MEIRNAITTNRFPVTIIENHSLHRTTEYIVTLIINYNKFNIINGRMDTMTDIISVISSVKWAYCYTSCTVCCQIFLGKSCRPRSAAWSFASAISKPWKIHRVTSLVKQKSNKTHLKSIQRLWDVVTRSYCYGTGHTASERPIDQTKDGRNRYSSCVRILEPNGMRSYAQQSYCIILTVNK
jgi:hypothetical protein